MDRQNIITYLGIAFIMIALIVVVLDQIGF